MLTPLKPHPSHNMLKMKFGDPYRLKCEHCGLTDLQDDVERKCRPPVDRIVPAHLNDDELWRRNGEYVSADVYDASAKRIAELEAKVAFIRQQVVNYIEAFERDPKTAEQHERAWRHLLNDLNR